MKQHQEDEKPIHGEPPDDALANGPIQDRSCQDLICLILFIACTVVFIVILSIGFSNGHPERLSYAYDSDGRACGQDPDVRIAPFIYLVAPYPGHFNRSVCVSQCPLWQEGETEPTSLNCVTNSIVTSCKQFFSFDGVNNLENISSILDVDYNNMDLDHLFNYSLFIYNSTDVFDRVCLPSGQKYVDFLIGNMSSLVEIQTFQEWVSDIQLTYEIIIASAGIAFIIGLFYMFILRYCAGVLTWLAILLYFVSLVLFIIYTKDESQVYKDQADINTSNGIQDSDNQELQTYYGLIGLMIVLIVVLAISVLSVICYFNRIRMAIAIIKTAASFVMDTPTVMLVPPIISLIVMGFWALWIVSFFYIYSVGDIKGRNDSPLATVTWDENIRYYLIYHLFYGLWSNALIQAFSCFIIASACCLWFYTQQQGQLISFHVLQSVKYAFFYHVGSLIFGALLLAIVQFVRFWLEYIHYQIKQVQGEPKQPLKCLLDCCRCYAACFERLISFLNKNAYIQIALTGKSFCVSAKNAFHLIWNNAGQYAITNGIGGVFCTVCKLFIALVTTFLCYEIITQSEKYSKKLNSPIVPTLLFFIIAYVIGDLFMTVYGMSIDTVLQCAITEEEICKKTGRPSKNTPQPVREFLDQYKKH